MKKISLFLLLLITQSCFQKADNEVSKTEKDVTKTVTNTFELVETRSDTIVKNLKVFMCHMYPKIQKIW